VHKLVFFLEEPSAKEMLIGLVPRLLPADINPLYIVFQGKQDLDKNLRIKLSNWKAPNTFFVILRDQDFDDCKEIKERLEAICSTCNKKVLIRIACKELESFYLGDLEAVEKGLTLNGLAKMSRKRKFRNPDELQNPAEILREITKYKYSKVAGSRAISKHLNLANNNSHSFKVLVAGINSLSCLYNEISE
jgi:hypothetical protein